MFESVCLKSSTVPEQRVDLAFLVDAMIYYQEVTIIVYISELERLIFRFGDQLKFFIETGRLNIQVKLAHLGTMDFSTNDQHSFGIDLWGGKNDSIERTLYKAHRLRVRNSTRNHRFVDEYLPLVSKFDYNEQLVEHIKSDFQRDEYIISSFRQYMSIVFPEYKLSDDLSVQLNPDGKFEDTFDKYRLESNVDMNEINNQFKQSKEFNGFEISYTGFIHALSETRGDTYIAADLRSEIVTSSLYSKLMQLQLNEAINRRAESQENIDDFQEYVINEARSIGDAFAIGLITRKELLNILEKGQSFRDWVGEIEDKKSLVGEYTKAVLETSVYDKLPSRTIRFAIFEGVGVLANFAGAGGMGTLASTGLSVFDAFYLDKLLKGWKPNQYIDNSIKPLASRRTYNLYA